MRYALIKNGITVNIIEASQQFVDALVTAGKIDSYTTDDVTFDPNPKRRLTRLEFFQRFTPSEQAAVRTAAKSNVGLENYLAMMELATYIDLDRPDTIAGVQQLEAATLIGPGRAAEILA